MEPITIAAMVGMSAAGAIINYLNSEEARKIAKSERAKLEALVNKLQSPQFETSTLTPPELKVLETYTPQVAEMVYEVAPELVTVSDRARMGQRAQDAALARLQSISQGTAPGANLEVIAALDNAMQRGGAQRDAILADMGRQGLTPSSSAYSNLQYGAANQSQKNMFMTSLQAAIADRARRDQATTQSADLGGNINRFEIDLERLNDDIVNQVNRRNTEARRNYLANRADEMNRASMYNMGMRQKYSDQNLNNLYQAQVQGRDLRNKQVQANYDTERDKLSALAGISTNRVGDAYRNAQDTSNLISGLTNAGMTGAMMYGNAQERQKDRDAWRPTTEYRDSVDMGQDIPLSTQPQTQYYSTGPYQATPTRYYDGTYDPNSYPGAPNPMYGRGPLR